MNTTQSLTDMTKRFLSNGLAGKDEVREWMQHFAIRTGRACTTNGHVFYAVDVPTVVPGDDYLSYDENMTQLALKVPAFERILPKHKNRIDIDLPDQVVSAIRYACAAAVGVSETLERRWRREPKKTRTASAPTAAVRLEGGEYGLSVVVYAQNRCAFRQRVSETYVAGEFMVELDADYLLDALDALEEWSLDRIVLNAAPELSSMSPVTLRHESGPTLVLIMPRRI